MRKFGLASAVTVALLLSFTSPPLRAESDWQSQRDALAREVQKLARATGSSTGKPAIDDRVIAAIATVPRHEFVPEQFQHQAYENRPLPIGNGQTISQPYIVALMTDLAAIDAESSVLEIGTGSGYQAAVLAELVEHVYTIEIIATLGERAEATLARLDYDNVSVRIGDGYQGWPEHAPFDAIVVTAAPESIPEPLIEQLAVGGRLVIPVGPQRGGQSLKLLTKLPDGEIETTSVLPVRFVPFTRE
ncbi:MAG: protein-L-isoaspartate(D-aspartate) O-methyltransferase [Pseudomonadota bacterium]